jgi:glycosyltransferase involved in cell wall biosynthesis
VIKPKALVFSGIPVHETGGAFETDSRWAMDINMQAEYHSVTLLCPVEEFRAPDSAPLRRAINVVRLGTENADELIRNVDFVQLPGNNGWRPSRVPRTLQRLAIKQDKTAFVGISSDRAKTAWINRRKSVLGAAKAMVRWLDVRTAQRFLVRKSTGVFVVGAGIRHLARPNGNVHVGIASWIDAKQIVERGSQAGGPIRICCASRLEPMKGVRVGVHAIAKLANSGHNVRFDIVGEGPELGDLTELVEKEGVSEITRFLGQLAYPDEFFSYLQTVDIVLLTNLNDEQPRLIFDAISQGCLLLCPNSAAYSELGLDKRLLYGRGQSDIAAHALERLIMMDPKQRQELRTSLGVLASEFTLESMHRRRAEWMKASMPRCPR